MLRSLVEMLAGLDAQRAARRFRRAVIDFAFAGAALVLGLGFLVAAAFLFVVERYGPLYTTTGFGIGFIVLAGLILIVHRMIVGIQARRRAEEKRAEQVKSFATTAALAALPAIVRSSGVVGQVVIPLVAIAAYAIYRENVDSDEDLDTDPDETL
ncbi:hypothetical protein FQ775_05180 [Nitratireductor mangrovi]|uniref:Phage holin family protein n=1 Tax=Nitratireductor mangrovi TaxID=2599600 RepID=A0A5B8KW66_9HYPH|nr:hypothetical protein [Nitratireductor mangrovi]QDY99815.1 hypothetical protein FQ775_05180 [Nitratireductor mangrovi]